MIAIGDKLRSNLEKHLFGAFSAAEIQQFRNIIVRAVDLVLRDNT